MKIAKLSLHQDEDKSFIVHYEHFPFAPFHHHPEYELVLILKGKGRRMVGDSVDRFEENDLIFTGPFLPHQWICDEDKAVSSKAFVIQFSYDFLGDKFFEIPENAGLKKFLHESVRGLNFYGKTKQKIISILLKMIHPDEERLYNLFAIFNIFSSTNEFIHLSSLGSNESFMLKENENMQKALQYILQNFHNKILVNDLLDLTNMSYSSFYSHFYRNYKMSYKQYLLEVRIEYACKLLKNENLNVSGVATDCGFGNLSNFNRQFRKIKMITPSQYQKQLFEASPGKVEEVNLI
jgi:AraC-like DNA-binding protein